MLLAKKVAIVTGASGGIGSAIARSLAQSGARVVAGYYRNQESASQLVDALQADGHEAVAQQVDVTDNDSVKDFVSFAQGQYGGLDIVVNNAGITRDGLLLRMSEDDWDAVFDTNLKSMYRLAKAVVRPMMKQRSGRIINISSVVGLNGNAGQANYCAAKAGVVGFTKSLAKELGSRSITVNAVAPGFIKTEITADLPEKVVSRMQDTIPLQRLGEAEDVSGIVTFLASGAASYITGQVFTVDGGLSLGA